MPKLRNKEVQQEKNMKHVFKTNDKMLIFKLKVKNGYLVE